LLEASSRTTPNARASATVLVLFAPILPENRALGGWTREDKGVGENLATGIDHQIEE
jgi:hypothetical protein